jgi:uncharacterized radical SAM superfamily Fe-S cluster-containing enzyme
VLDLFDYTVQKSVRAVCPRCFAENENFDPEYPTDICDGHLVERDGAIYLRRFCRRGHGEVWSLYEEHAELWRYLQQWRVPTRKINPDTQQIFPIPTGYEYGLGPTHLQHSCIFLLDITSQCNLSCPACYAVSSPENSLYMPLDHAITAVKTAIESAAGHLDVVMLSGGEPTVHPQFREMIEQMVASPITRILVNTNGIRIANDDAFLSLLEKHRDRVEVYLQYDGQDVGVQQELRGVDLREIKCRAIARLADAAIFTTLVMTVTRVNQHLIGEVLDTCFATNYIGGAMFQPVFASGRAPGFDPMSRVTTTGVLQRMADQSRFDITPYDMIALPCSHPDCCSIGYFLKNKAGKLNSLASVVGEQALRDNLSIFGNSIAFSDGLKQVHESLLGLMSESMTLSRPELLVHLKNLCAACDLGGLTDMLKLAFGKNATSKFVGERIKRVTIKHFMDANTLITERLEQCCVHVAGGGNDPVRMPFCAARLFPKVRAKALEGTTTRAAIAKHG